MDKDKIMQEIIKQVVEYNTKDKNILKVAEECNELAEVMIKYVVKSERLKPPISKIIEECGDVIFRIKVIAEQFQIWNDIEQRQQDKANQLDEWMTEQKYKGGV